MICSFSAMSASRRLTSRLHNCSAVLLATIASSAIFLGNASAQLIQPDDIAPFEAMYKVGNHLINAGTATLSLTQDDDQWSYSLITKPRGIIKLAGKGKINEASTLHLAELEDGLQIQPQIYRYRQDNEDRRAIDATFDWSNNSVTHVYRGKETIEFFDTPVVDRLSATLLVMNALRREFESMELSVFDTNRIKTVTFSNTGAETLDTPLGQVETIRVVNNNKSGGSRETTTWFAPSLDYVPVKIEHRKRGELVARLNLLQLNNRATNK